MIKRHPIIWIMILAFITICLPDGTFWEISSFSILVIASIIAVWRGWQAYRTRTLLRVELIKSTWQQPGYDHPKHQRLLELGIEVITREPLQITDIELIIGGRHCYAVSDEMQITPHERKERHCVHFLVPDVWEVDNHANLRAEFAGSEFQSGTFKVSAMPSIPDKEDSHK